jgi:hypothetical protein
MKRFLPLVLLVAVLAALAPGTGRADDAAVAASVTKWTLRIGPKAANLNTKVSSSSSPAQALAFLRSFTKVARQGASAISTTTPSSRTGASLKLLAKRSYVNFGNAGALLIKAVQMVKAGKSETEITPLVNKATKLANAGSIQLKNASALIPKTAK